MNSRLTTGLILTLAASFFAAAPSYAQTAQAQAQAHTETAMKPYLPDVQRSISGYFNTLNIRADQVKEGLTIPWVSTNKETNWAGYPSYAFTHGFSVATGKISPVNKCPEFKVIALNHVVKDTSRVELNFGICP